MRDVPRLPPSHDLDDPAAEIAEMVRRFYADVARVHSQQLVGQAVSVERDAASAGSARPR